jgi:hypothetical protein
METLRPSDIHWNVKRTTDAIKITPSNSDVHLVVISAYAQAHVSQSIVLDAVKRSIHCQSFRQTINTNRHVAQLLIYPMKLSIINTP